MINESEEKYLVLINSIDEIKLNYCLSKAGILFYVKKRPI